MSFQCPDGDSFVLAATVAAILAGMWADASCYARKRIGRAQYMERMDSIAIGKGLFHFLYGIMERTAHFTRRIMVLFISGIIPHIYLV